MEAFIVVPEFSSRPFENEQICVYFTFRFYREHFTGRMYGTGAFEA